MAPNALFYNPDQPFCYRLVKPESQTGLVRESGSSNGKLIRWAPSDATPARTLTNTFVQSAPRGMALVLPGDGLR